MDMKFVSPRYQLPGQWTDHALCQGLTDVFFGPVAERPERRVEREAVAYSYCMACPVIDQCKQFARDNNEHGFWGGENEVERAVAGFAPRSPSRRAVIVARQLVGSERRAAANELNDLADSA